MKFEQIEKAQRILIYGYGIEGRSSRRFLQFHFPKAKVDIFDENMSAYSVPPDFHTYDVIVVSPGVDRKKIQGADREKMTSQTEIFFANIPEEKRKQVIGISGTKGKSTTSKFCMEVIRRSGRRVMMGGNMGKPLLGLFDDFVENKKTFLVAELSSFQLEYLKTSPGIAIFLNFFQDHLDRYSSMEEYFASKKPLWVYQLPGDTLVAPESLDPSIQLETQAQIIRSEELPMEFLSDDSLFRPTALRTNLGTVYALSEVLEIDEDIIRRVARRFESLPYRLELFLRKNRIQFYDDSISTNPDSTLIGVELFGKQLGSIVLGGQDRDQDFEPLMKKLAENSSVQVIILRSETSDKILDAAHKYKIPRERLSVQPNLQRVVDRAFDKTRTGHVCLLSPAAPSFDSFSSFQERGDLFKKYVRDYVVEV